MTLRRTLTKGSGLGRLRDRLRVALQTAGSGDTAPDRGSTADGPASTNESLGNLFSCPHCSVVYIAEEKRVCPRCERDVEQVRSTFRSR
ncbi:hypothetical protein [Halopiger djelfimassiliensis]|uniref:hypothetical protein n=1 Tax=Halopiger djelfimassiliensis TaxID=1293047 RepID=UPI0006781A9D|nr:hypothetical protein [Halopiger djelfimassiliensis]